MIVLTALSIGGNGLGNMSFLIHYGSLCNRFSDVTPNMIAVLVLIPIVTFQINPEMNPFERW